ncbi:sesquiterpene synthase-like [Gossypium australe]|uniref:Sesquiterpene synthase-like n=1 Tax=Gossypium australe TaxID=47621 RepID=A0A5B6X2K3_9ROSI|nr:sesquiterpene synthase-like [Gossypium australe]
MALPPDSSSILPVSSLDSPVVPPSPTPPLHRTLRLPKQPQWMQDYVSMPFPDFYSSSHLPYPSCSFAANISAIIEPQTYQKAILDSRWIDAMKQEI